MSRWFVGTREKNTNKQISSLSSVFFKWLSDIGTHIVWKQHTRHTHCVKTHRPTHCVKTTNTSTHRHTHIVWKQHTRTPDVDDKIWTFRGVEIISFLNHVPIKTWLMNKYYFILKLNRYETSQQQKQQQENSFEKFEQFKNNYSNFSSKLSNFWFEQNYVNSIIVVRH